MNASGGGNDQHTIRSQRLLVFSTFVRTPISWTRQNVLKNAGFDPECVHTQMGGRTGTGVTAGSVVSGRCYMLMVDMLHHSVILKEQQVSHK